MEKNIQQKSESSQVLNDTKSIKLFEDDIEDENAKINALFAQLDSNIQNDIMKMTNKIEQKYAVLYFSDLNLQRIFNNLKEREKKDISGLKMRDKYIVLKELLKEEINQQKKTKKESVKIQNESKEESDFKDENISQQLTKKESLQIQDELEEESDVEDENIPQQLTKKELTNAQKKFQELIEKYYNSNPFAKKSKMDAEFEVRFGTRDIKPITKNDYDNVIKKLKSMGFQSNEQNGFYMLRIQTEYLDSATGTFRQSNIRAEINGINNIQEFCKTNDIKGLIQQMCVKFIKKNNVIEDGIKLFPINFDDFNFRVSYVNEESISVNKGIVNYIVTNWKTSKKSFRYINRVTFSHPDYPINVDMSIVKKTDIINGKPKMYYTMEESDIFNKQSSYEIELEVNNTEIGPGTKFNSPSIVLDKLKKVIKYVLCGLQKTNYPVSYFEQKEIINSYMKLLYKENYNPSHRVYPSQFVGPNSFTLQLKNVAPSSDNSEVVNIRKNFTVTDKADGERHLMYISNEGKIYLINTNMNVIFTGAKTINNELFETLLDGELIMHNKVGKYINLYAAFDLYYLKTKDIRNLPFMPMLNNKNYTLNDSRHNLLSYVINNLNPISVLTENNIQTSLKKIISEKNNKIISPIRIEMKKFYPENPERDDIFNACKNVLEKLYEYNTDGLIFTHAYYGVGGEEINKTGPLTKITWKYSFKWKPPQFNTIDFLVTTLKNENGEDLVKSIYEEGINNNISAQLSEYKVIQLRCTFNEKIHGFINPCQDIIDDNLPEYKLYEDKNDNESKPVQFYPTNPYDPNAGICNIMLKIDTNYNKQMFTEENEVFTDNTIVEFRYELDNEKGWRWIPLRVRYDKTTEMLQGLKNYGNAYHVANSNWQSIHNPISEDMIMTGLNIPSLIVDEDIYYNKPEGKMKTQALKHFHNLYVKKLLIKNVSKKGDILIDYSCGKAGDLPKWINAQLGFVFGIDLSPDNIENKLDGACARYLKSRRENKHMPYALFVNGNSTLNIKNGSALLNDKAIQITKAIFGVGNNDPNVIGKGVSRQYGIAQEGFNISSCQFSLHYFFEKPDTLQGFMRNLSECTRLNGYFIGTAYDGKTVFKLLKKKQSGESIEFIENNKKICEITKLYDSDTFEDNSSSIGYKINVFQESINNYILEYLINFDYLNRVMENYGFKLIGRDEAQLLGFPEGSGLFSELFLNMIDEISKNKYKANDYGDAMNMTATEKKISFLNRYFIYKKIRHVNAEKVELELGEYTESEEKNNKMESNKAITIAKKEEKIQPKIIPLKKKLLLVPATEAIEEETKLSETIKEKQTTKREKKTKTKTVKPKLIIEDEE